MTADKLAKALQRPLITGASVSADWSTTSPSKRLARRYAPSEAIRTLAFGGRPGRETIKFLTSEVLKDRSAILAIDFFFWDSTLPDLRPSLEALDNLIARARERALPLVLGEIPELLPGRQPQRQRLNEALRTACSASSPCYLMPFVELHTRLMRNGFLEVRGRHLSLKEIVPDGLHLSETASEYLADVMKAMMLGQPLP